MDFGGIEILVCGKLNTPIIFYSIMNKLGFIYYLLLLQIGTVFAK